MFLFLTLFISGHELWLKMTFLEVKLSCNLPGNFWFNLAGMRNASTVVEHQRNARVDQRHKQISDILEHLDNRRDGIANQSAPLVSMRS